jgi:hypothetical protein
MATIAPRQDAERALTERNRRTAFVLVGWIAVLVVVSVIVVWLRN